MNKLILMQEHNALFIFNSHSIDFNPEKNEAPDNGDEDDMNKFIPMPEYNALFIFKTDNR